MNRTKPALDALSADEKAAELAVGILLGLYECRDGESETLLEYSPDYAAERASDVVSRCGELGIDMPNGELRDLLPEWSPVLR